MLMLKALLGLFPQPFRQRFGDEWLEVSQQLLDRAQKSGPEGKARAWVSLCSDVGVQAPVAHAKEAWKTMVGTPPVLAGAGVLGGTWLLTKHWGGRPAMALGRGLIKYAWALGAGGLFAMGLHEWLEQRAWLGSDQAAQSGMPGINPQHLIIVAALPLALAMLAAGWPRLKATAHRITVNQVLSGFLAFALGFYLVLTSIFLGQLREVANDAISDFIVYPEIVKMPSQGLFSDNPQEWTAEQKQWFDPTHPWKEKLLPEKKAEWCAIKEAQLNLWRKTIVSRSSSSTGVPLLLWQALQRIHFTQGCIDEATWLKRHDDAAFSIREGTGLFHRTWEPLTAIHPLVDQILAAHHVVWPRLVMSPQKYCLAISHTITGPSEVVDVGQLNNVCLGFQAHAEGAEEIAAWEWSWSKRLEQNNLKVKPMTEQQRQEVRRTLEATRNQWLQEIGAGN